MAWSTGCICGQSFTSPQAFTNHRRSCSKSKKWLSSTLEQAKAVQEAKKCHKMEASLVPPETTGPFHHAPLSGTHQQVGYPILGSPSSSLMFICVCQTTKTSVDLKDLNQSLAECRQHHEHCQLPKWYWDVAPERPAALPPSALQVMSACMRTEPNVPQFPSLYPSQQDLPPAHLVRRILKSSCNTSGLLWQYYMTCFPDHDPGEYITSNDLNTSPNLFFASPVHSYDLYPNQSSFLLGEWYWNDGKKKLQLSFQNLLKIVRHSDFPLEDVAGKNWPLIDGLLSGDRHKSSNKEDDWEDEHVSRLGGRIKTPIRIIVLFH